MFSYSNVASVTRQPSLTIPTAFTPNGDGLNDVLEVKGRFLGNYTFVVVDRNGQEVFRGTQRSDVWDGRIAGRAPVLGSYVWRFQQPSDDGQPFVRSGAVTILK
nr:gliding motility-associated C-terminal domain-containing protein [Hymenobacter cyanobacteriorum]